MSNAVRNNVFECSKSRGVARLVLLAIADRADDHGRAFPGTAELCRRCNASRDAVIEARKELQRLGELVIEDQGGSNGERRSHRYLITLPEPVGNPDQSENATGRDLPPTSREFRLEPVGNPDPNSHKQSKNNSAKRERFDAGAVELPFSSEQFSEAWGTWIQHRREKRQPLTPTATKQQLAKLKAIGEERAITAIEHSVANSWTGLFEPKTTQAEKPRFSSIGEPLNDAAHRQPKARVQL